MSRKRLTRKLLAEIMRRIRSKGSLEVEDCLELDIDGFCMDHYRLIGPDGLCPVCRKIAEVHRKADRREAEIDNKEIARIWAIRKEYGLI